MIDFYFTMAALIDSKVISTEKYFAVFYDCCWVPPSSLCSALKLKLSKARDQHSFAVLFDFLKFCPLEL